MIFGISMAELLPYAWVILLVAYVPLFVVAFIAGRLVKAGDQISAAAWEEKIADLKVAVETKLQEKEEIQREAISATKAIDEYNKVKQDHEKLDKMRQDLDDFIVEEDRRINDLESRRNEAVHMLAEVLATLEKTKAELNGYPAPITGPDDEWEELLKNRKQEYDELEARLLEATRRLSGVQTKLDGYPPEILDPDSEVWNEMINKRQQELNQLEDKKDQKDKLVGEVEDLESKKTLMTVRVGELEQKINDLKKEHDEAKQPTIDKLEAFRSKPKCLEGYEDERTDLNEMSEEELLNRFHKSLHERHMNYPERIVRAFHTALKVNQLSPLTVLSGLSGTGKSQLPREYARFFGIYFLHVPVEPGWDSPQDLLGFYDFVSERYRPTDRARALGHFDKNFAKNIGINPEIDWSQRMLIILLDEMNLARTEYYFSEFLSRLEMRGSRQIPEVPDPDAVISIDLPYAKGEIPQHLYAPYNVLWIGTLNEDETTQALSDKVLDRANSIRFATPDPANIQKFIQPPDAGTANADGYLPYEIWFEWSNDGNNVAVDDAEVDKVIGQLAALMKNADRGFGYRIAQSIRSYINLYPGDDDWRRPMIDQINMRLLPKLSGSEMTQGCRDTLRDLEELCRDELGDEEFANVLNGAVENSQISQIFSWPGYTYS